MQHTWRRCHPVVLLPADQIRLEMAWSLVSDRDRFLFHEYCCLGQKSEIHLDAMERVIRILGPVLP